MQIERITTALRPRTRGEAVDLGFRMAQNWYWPLFALWMMVALPIFVVLHAVPVLSMMWAGLIMWWLKPLFEQAQLYFMSRALFGEYLTLGQALKETWASTKSQIIPLLTWRRLSFSRSFNNPVSMLEGLNGKQRKERLRVLHFNQRNASTWMHLAIYHFEAVLWFGAIALIAWLIPEHIEWFDFENLFAYEETGMSLINNFVYLLVMATLAPFYVCGGFSLYLSRRTELECWDIELSFKQIAKRVEEKNGLSSFAVICLSVGLLFGFSHNPSYALDQAQAKERIESILSQDAFGKQETVKRWEKIETEEAKKEKAPDWLEQFFEDLADWFGEVAPGLASFLEFALWVGVAIAVVLILMRYTQWLDWLGSMRLPVKKAKAPPTHLFGLEVREESLPDNIIATVQSFIASGRTRDAVSLLYRAALIRLIHLHELVITKSSTEGECKRLVDASRPQSEAQYFSELTQVWLLLAYAHEPPARERLEQLCVAWPQYYDEVSDGGE